MPNPVNKPTPADRHISEALGPHIVWVEGPHDALKLTQDYPQLDLFREPDTKLARRRWVDMRAPKPLNTDYPAWMATWRPPNHEELPVIEGQQPTEDLLFDNGTWWLRDRDRHKAWLNLRPEAKFDEIIGRQMRIEAKCDEILAILRKPSV